MCSDSVENKTFLVRPSVFGACMRLTKGKVTAAVYLNHIWMRSSKKTLTNGGEGGWVALSATQWRYEMGFTRHQFDDAVRTLKQEGLITTFRRKFRKKDPAALSWIKLTAGVTSAISDIQHKAGISAFASEPETLISALADKLPHTISENPDALNTMTILENEDTDKNDVIAKTTAVTTSPKINKLVGEEVDKKWFYAVCKKIYTGMAVDILPEPYKASSFKSLWGVVGFLEGGCDLSITAPEHVTESTITILQTIIRNWDSFKSFAETQNNAYNMPVKPQLFALAHQQKILRQYAHLRSFCERAAGMLPTDLDELHIEAIRNDAGGKMTEILQVYDKSPAHEREEYLNTALNNMWFMEMHNKLKKKKDKQLAQATSENVPPL